MKKMKTKRLLSLMLAYVMLLISAMSVAAEKESGIKYTFTKWNFTRYTVNTPWNEETEYVKVTLDGGYNGTSGAEISFQSPIEANRYMMLSNTLMSKMTYGSTYRVKLRYKGSGDFLIAFDWTERDYADKYTVESTDGEWKYVYKDVTMPSGREATYVQLLFDREQYSVIDDMSIQLMTDTDGDGTADTPNGTELVTDSSFSEYKATYSFDIEDENIYTQNTWKYENVGLNGTDGGYMKLTGKYAHSGNCAMYMKGENGDGFMTVQPRTTVPFKPGNTYKIEFYAMYTKGVTEVTAEWSRFGAMKGTAWTKSAPDSKGWIKHSRTATVDANRGNIWFLLDNADEVIIDDVSVYILDENGNPIGNNLVDGDFEDVLLPEDEDVLSPDSDIIYTGDYTIFIRYEALFEPEPPEIEISRNIILCPGANGAAVVDKTSSAVGEVVTITVTPDDGYELDTISGVEVTKVNETTYTFTMPDENVEICVTFKKIPLDIWESLSESGYYIENGQKLGIIRYLFDVTFLDEVGNISESGIKYIKAGNIAENVGESAFSGSSNTGTATTFFGDIVNITEDRKDDRYYAVGYIIADGKTYWSKPVEGIPNFEKRVN